MAATTLQSTLYASLLILPKICNVRDKLGLLGLQLQWDARKQHKNAPSAGQTARARLQMRAPSAGQRARARFQMKAPSVGQDARARFQIKAPSVGQDARARFQIKAPSAGQDARARFQIREREYTMMRDPYEGGPRAGRMGASPEWAGARRTGQCAATQDGL
jgi:hypothetical protein